MKDEEPPACEQRLSPTDFGRLRSLLEKHDQIMSVVKAAEIRNYVVSAAKSWLLFLGALYVILTGSLRDVIARWIK